MEDRELNALLTLLNDPDPVVSEEVEKSLMNKGVKVVPSLERAWERSMDEVVQNRLEDIIDDIQFSSTRKGLKKWYENGAKDLITGAYWVANFQYPDLELSEVQKPVEELYNEIQKTLANKLTPLENIKAINHVLFNTNQFNSNKSNFFTPQNFYINNVLERKKGNPLSLGLLYSALAQKSGLPIYGVSLPVNFLLGYYGTNKPSDAKREDVLFFINPYNSGAALSNKDLDAFLKRQNLKPEQDEYAAIFNASIIKRLINNLIFAYEKIGYPEKSKSLAELRNVISFSKI